jgi:3-oxoacyl-[acyl-carrier protein] reductase
MSAVDGPKVAVVTGAGGGIGRELVAGLLAKGCAVAATDNDRDKLVALEKIDAVGGGPLRRLAMDVCDPDQVRRVADSITSELGGVDILINNAGVFRKGSILGWDDATARHVLEVNLLGAMSCMAAFGTVMRRRRSGRIVNIASIAGVTGSALSPAYAASKAGLIAATLSCAREFAECGIAVNALAPGFCDTPMLAPDKGLVQSFTVPRIPLRRIATPAEVAEVAIFLATCRTPYLTGSVLTMDGGLHVG